MKRRVAILGGGMGALTTAFELTSRPGWRDRYEITVYQMGFRLGGKGASGVNRARQHRIEEHGLHVMWGFYENVFRIVRAAYAELGRAPGSPLATFDEAFAPHDRVVVPEKRGESWHFHGVHAPRHDGIPGVTPPVLEPLDLVPKLLRTAIDALTLTDPDAAPPSDRLAAALPRLLPLVRAASREGAPAPLEIALRNALAAIVGTTVRTARFVRDRSAVVGLDLARLLAERGPAGASPDDVADRATIAWLLARSARYLGSLAAASDDERFTSVIVDLTLTCARGLVADGMLAAPRDWLRLDDVDFRTWLRTHGAREETIASPLLEGLHAAAYGAGMPLSAGAMLHGCIRLAFTYQGAILYKMQAGMGETIFAPLHMVLKRRGVRFRFFHVVDELQLSDDGKSVQRVLLDRQATVRGGGEYEPLVDVDGLPCWPTEPLFEQLEEGDELASSGEDIEDWWTKWPARERVTLERGRDFDLVVLGTSLGVVPHVCRNLVADANNPRFAAMVASVATAQTQSAQVWMTPSLPQLGWKGAPPIVIPFAAPFDTWADMSHLLSRERWQGVGHLAYLTARMDDDEPVPPRAPSDYAKRQYARVRKNLGAWTRKSAGALWPLAATTHDPCALSMDLVADPEERTGEARLDAAYWCAVKNPSDRYVLSLPGTGRARLRADESGYDNLVLAGDWTRTPMNAGCLEGATMSGIHAARTIDPGVPVAVGDWLEAVEGPIGTPPPQRVPRIPTRPPAPLARRPEKPAYVARDGDLMAAVPADLAISLHAFGLSASTDALARICDEHLNHGAVRYAPLGPFVIAYFAQIDARPVADPLATVPERECGIWLPVVARSCSGRPERVAVYSPYLWVDSGTAMTNGREIFGFAKTLGSIELPEAGRSSMAVDTAVVDRFGKGARMRWERILAASPDEAGGGMVQQAKGAARALAGVLSATGVGDPVAQTVRTLTDASRGTRMVLLKQLPDATDPRRAAYQAIVEADVAFTGPVESAVLPGAWNVDVREVDSHRIAATLGLEGERTSTGLRAPAFAAGRARFDARIGVGDVVWEA